MLNQTVVLGLVFFCFFSQLDGAAVRRDITDSGFQMQLFYIQPKLASGSHEGRTVN